jgi:cytochrome c-type biogenesis protein
MNELFTTLTRAVEGAPLVAIAASFLWGVLSILLSPCHLASIPLIVGFIDEQGRISTGRAFSISALFAVGILITIGAIGAVTAIAGRMMGDVGAYGNYLVAIIFFLVGLHLLDVIPMPWSGSGRVGMRRRGLLAAFILGLYSASPWGPVPSPIWPPCWGSPSGWPRQIYHTALCCSPSMAWVTAPSSWSPAPAPRSSSTT